MDMATVEMHMQEHRQTIEQHGFCIVGEPEFGNSGTRIQIGYADDHPLTYEFIHIPLFDCWRIGRMATSIYSAEEIAAIGMPAVDPSVPSEIIPILPSLVEFAYGVAIQNGWMRDSTE
jgi:hypothetical protein